MQVAIVAKEIRQPYRKGRGVMKPDLWVVSLAILLVDGNSEIGVSFGREVHLEFGPLDLGVAARVLGDGLRGDGARGPDFGEPSDPEPILMFSKI